MEKEKVVKYEWDGEKIKQTFETKKYTPKEIINAIANLNAQKHQAEGQKNQFENQLKQVTNNIVNIDSDLTDLKVLEEKCIVIQKEKLELYIKQLTPELKEEAQKQADETIGKDPNAYAPAQVKNMPYLNFQKLLATNTKVAENISSQIITKYLYDEPIFKTPFE